MGIHRLNHAVLFVSDLPTSVAFYTEVLGFRVVAAGGSQAAFLQAADSTNDHDLGLFAMGAGAGPSTAGRGAVGLYHLAWELGTLDELAEHADRLAAAGALVGSSDHGTTKSLYGRDPDGLEFELAWIVPADLLDAATATAGPTIEPLDLAAERKRYGGQTRGGVGILPA